MMKFLLQCFFITTVLFLGVLVGIQMTSNNMVKMTGEQRYSTVNFIKMNESVYTETVHEEKLTSHDLEQKQQKLEKIETFNLFSQVGVKLSDVLNKLFSSILTKLSMTVGNVLT